MVVNSKRVEPGTEKIVHQHFSDWPLARSEGLERKSDEMWRMSMRTDSRRHACSSPYRPRAQSLPALCLHQTETSMLTANPVSSLCVCQTETSVLTTNPCGSLCDRQTETSVFTASLVGSWCVHQTETSVLTASLFGSVWARRIFVFLSWTYHVEQERHLSLELDKANNTSPFNCRKRSR